MRRGGGRKDINTEFAQTWSKCFPSVHNNRSEAYPGTELEYRYQVLTLAINQNLFLKKR